MCLIEPIPERYREKAARTALALEQLNDTLIAAHTNLDGDALGSMAAAGWILGARGKRFALYTPTGVPQRLSFLDLPGECCHSLAELPFEPKSALYLDCSEPARLGEELAARYAEWPSVNIDHHLGSRGMGSLYNFIDPEAAATSQLVAYSAISANLKLTGNLGSSVGLGLMTDTGGFCHGNTTADVFALCAGLARNGCDFAKMRETLQHTWTIGKLHLWGRIFGQASMEVNDSVVICVITLKELAEYGCTREDVEGVAEWLRRLRQARVAAILREEGKNLCKFSLRSFGDDDVRKIATALGGGGHRNAAGGTIQAPPARARTILLEAIAKSESF